MFFNAEGVRQFQPSVSPWISEAPPWQLPPKPQIPCGKLFPACTNSSGTGQHNKGAQGLAYR
ncbi:MAG: hypothetical protein LC770_04930, partial [Acidobacteria bacterium]|nr:hypothetical protein [Acidobacteriota bacterium]